VKYQQLEGPNYNFLGMKERKRRKTNAHYHQIKPSSMTHAAPTERRYRSVSNYMLEEYF
jgi:hypothetical protein